MNMLTDMLSYDLPESLIAQYPSEKRDESRLMVVERHSGLIHLDIYKNISKYLIPGDCMVLNNTRVIRARLTTTKSTGGKIELFLLNEISPGIWKALVRPSAKVKVNTLLHCKGNLKARILEKGSDGIHLVQFDHTNLISYLEAIGEIPLPPYIKRKSTDGSDAERYQTVYAERLGSVAAPTAGLHLTKELLEELKQMGIREAYLTLHVGYGTFKPITAQCLEEHKVEEEEYIFEKHTATLLNTVRSEGKKILAVGTTCARVLETCFVGGRFVPGKGKTDLYIYPPYQFKSIDMLQTNFHLPKSSLLALVCAFMGYELTMKAYNLAIREKFRFYSYGDVMLIK